MNDKIKNDAEKIKNSASQMRKNIITMTYNTGRKGAHIGGSLSIVEIMAVLYLSIMNYDKYNPSAENCDRLILSKGHGAMAQYAAMEQAGIISADQLFTFKNNNTLFTVHPSVCPEIGISYASGSLGMGLSQAVGAALALRLKSNNSAHIYVIMGDGECDEGSVWEAAMSAAHFNLSNITCIIDKNNIQNDGETKSIMNSDSLTEKWRSFGWIVSEADGHDIISLLKSFGCSDNLPKAIICHTVKGKGISFMESNPKWHNGVLNETQYHIAMSEQS